MTNTTIKTAWSYLEDSRCREIGSKNFYPMTQEKSDELFTLLKNEYPTANLGWWYLEVNREINKNETRSFWWSERWIIYVLDKDGNLTVHEAKYYPILLKQYSLDPNMIWVSGNPTWKTNFWWKTWRWIVLKQWNVKINVDFSKIEIKQWDEKMECDKLSKEELDNFYSDKMHKYTKFFVEKKNSYKPLFKVKLNNDVELYTSARICTSWYQYVIWYTKIDGEWRLRLFYRSHSEWAWRACPWTKFSDGENKLSKWGSIPNYCYETTTKVDYHLWDVFDNHLSSIVDEVNPILSDSGEFWEEILADEMKEETHIDWLFSSSEIWELLIDVARGELSRRRNKEGRRKCLLSYMEHIRKKYIEEGKWKPLKAALFWVSKAKFGWMGFWRRDEDVVKLYKKAVPSGLDIGSMQKIKNAWYTYDHEYLWKVVCEPYAIKFKWEDILIYFSYAQNDPDLVWIEDFRYKKSRLNSFWIRDRQLNAAPLVWKPIDYREQVPYGDKKEYWENYLDVRFLYQWNPIIKKYKELRAK